MIALILYAVTAIFWSMFSLKMQALHNPDSSIYHFIAVGIVNLLLCPLCILIAILNLNWW